MDYIHFLVAARLAQADLKRGDEALEAGPDLPMRLVLIRHLLVAVANVADLEESVRALYQQHPDLRELIAPHINALKFAKYLRNISVGHLNPGLAPKALIWRAELHMLLPNNDVPSVAITSLMVLETAINTYVGDQGHRFFESETDLMYPPDNQRFLNFLGETVHASIRFTERLAEIAIPEVELVDVKENWFELAKKAGQMDFHYLTKGKR